MLKLYSILYYYISYLYFPISLFFLTLVQLCNIYCVLLEDRGYLKKTYEKKKIEHISTTILARQRTGLIWLLHWFGSLLE